MEIYRVVCSSALQLGTMEHMCAVSVWSSGQQGSNLQNSDAILSHDMICAQICMRVLSS